MNLFVRYILLSVEIFHNDFRFLYIVSLIKLLVYHFY